MSTYLQRLGRFSFRRRRLVVAVWLTVMVAVGTGATLAGGSFSSNFSIPGTESQRALDLLQQRLPASSAAGANSRLVFAAAAGSQLTGDARRSIERTLAQVATGKTVASVTDPFATGAVSRNNTVAYSVVISKVTAGKLTQADRNAVVRAERVAQAAGVRVYLSGDLGEQARQGGAEGIGVAVALVVLLVTFGSVVAAGLPLLSAGLGVGIGLMGIALASAFADLSSAVETLAMMLGLAVGIDYALLILSRHRTQVRDGIEPEASAAHAVGTAGSAVVFAGSTVMIALVALITTRVPFLAAMGLAAAGTVALAVLIALTLVPALLGFAGQRAVKGKHQEALADRPGARTLGARWVELVTRHRVPVIGVSVLATLALAAPALHLRLGLPDDSTAAAGTQKRQAYDLVTRAFGPGTSAQLTVVADIPNDGNAASTAATIRARLSALHDVSAVSAARLSPDKTLVIVTVTPSSGPSTTATTNLVHAIRAQQTAIRASTGAEVSVTGTTAVSIDVAQRMSDALIPYLAVIVVLAFVLLAIAFRSVLVPLSAMAGFLLSITAALGAMVAVFQDGFAASLFGISDPAPIVSLLPILLVGIIFGLAMDYQVFLVSRMREAHAHGADPQKAVHDGFQHSARVVTAAGLIMISVFAGFILPDDPIVKSMGFAMTVGILIDAFLIRMTLIPAVMSLLGNRAWWLPRWLDRLIPNVDIEGAALDRYTQRQRGRLATPSRSPAYAESDGL